MRYRFRCQLSSLPPPTYQRFILWRGNNISHRHKNSTIHQTVIYSAVFVPISLIFPPFHPLPFSLSLSFSYLANPSPFFGYSLLRSWTIALFCIYVSYLYICGCLKIRRDLDASFDRSAGFDHRGFWWFCGVILHKIRSNNEEFRIWELMEFSFKLIRNDDILYVIKRWYFLCIRSSLIYIGSLYLSCKI